LVVKPNITNNNIAMDIAAILVFVVSLAIAAAGGWFIASRSQLRNNSRNTQHSNNNNGNGKPKAATDASTSPIASGILSFFFSPFPPHCLPLFVVLE
jgi:hypothetical protein